MGESNSIAIVKLIHLIDREEKKIQFSYRHNTQNDIDVAIRIIFNKHIQKIVYAILRAF